MVRVVFMDKNRGPAVHGDGREAWWLARGVTVAPPGSLLFWASLRIEETSLDWVWIGLDQLKRNEKKSMLPWTRTNEETQAHTGLIDQKASP